MATRKTPINTNLPVVNVKAPGFKEKVTPKNSEKLAMLRCSCGNAHFRHAGYIHLLIPFLKPENEKTMTHDARQVLVCTVCKKSVIWAEDQIYDVSGEVDLNAWEKTEKELHKATGPGGEC